jgi:hypothetical protein
MPRRIPCVLFLVGCVSSHPTPEGANTTLAPSAAPPAPISLSDTEPLAQPLAALASWQLADRGDPMYLAALARQLGARQLEARVQEGGRAGAVALLAYEHAPDAYAERARLCALLPRLSAPFRGRALAALSHVLHAGPQRGEDAEPTANSTCRAALESLPGAALSEDERDTASAALAALGQ